MGRLAARTDPESRRWTYSYDLLGRLVQQTDPGGRTVSTTFDAGGRVRQRLLPGGGAETFTWDAASRLVSMAKDTFDGAATEHDSWQYVLDGTGLATQLVQTIGTTSPLVRTLQWTRDASGRVVAFDDGAGSGVPNWIDVTRDAWGRVVSVTPRGTTFTSTVTHDPWSGWTTARYLADEVLSETYGYNAAGEVTYLHEEDATSVLRDRIFERDPAGRVIAFVDGPASPGARTEMTRDLAGRVTSLLAPDGAQDDYYWSPMSQLVRVDRHSGSVMTSTTYQYDRAGLPILASDEFSSTRWSWDFAPLESTASYAVSRSGSSPEVGESRMLFDALGRIGRVDRWVDEWAPDRAFRWAPGAGATPVATAAFDAAGELSGDTRIVSSTHGVLAGVDRLTQAQLWTAPQLAATPQFDPDALRSGGRQAADIDESTLFSSAQSGARPVPASVTGDAAISGLALPSLSQIAGVFAVDVPTTAAERLASRVPRPDFIEPTSGLPDVASTVPSPVTETRIVSLLPRGVCTDDMHNVSCFSREELRLASDEAGQIFVQEIPKRPPIGGGPSYPQFVHQTPLRNPDIHPLGVNLANGTYQLSVSDLTIKGEGLHLELRRTYGSAFGLLGYSWGLDLIDERLFIEPSRIVWGRPGGVNIGFDVSDGGTVGTVCSAELGVASLRRESASVYLVRTGDGTIRRFDDGRLVRITRPGATPIEVQWDGRAPVAAILWSCDDDTSTNPVAASDCSTTRKAELGRLSFNVIHAENQTPPYTWFVRSVSATVGGSTDPLAARTVTYGGLDWPNSWNLLDEVSVACNDGSNPECASTIVARYLYNKDNPSPPSQWARRPHYWQIALWRVLDADQHQLLLLEYGYNSLEQRLMLNKITPANRAATTFTYAFKSVGQSSQREVDTATVTTNGRTSKRYYGNYMDGYAGLLLKVDRPDGSVMEYEYSDQGRLIAATWPSGRRQTWTYAEYANRIGSEYPTEYRDSAGPNGGALEDRVTCYAIDPLTNEPYRTKGPLAVARGASSPCAFTAQMTDPTETKQVFGWMTACDEQSDQSLNFYLWSWNLMPRAGEPPLPFQCTGSGAATWPWFAPMQSIGAAPGQAVDETGAIVPSTVRPITTNEYSLQGRLTRTIAADGTVTESTYLDPGALGPSAGSTEGLGHLAGTKVRGADNVLLSDTDVVYDLWGNATQTRRKQRADSASRLVSSTVFDLRGRAKEEHVYATDAPASFASTKYAYDTAGRLTTKWVDRTQDIAASERAFTRMEYTYNDAGSLIAEQTFGTETGGASIAERRWAFDAFGNTVRELTAVNSNNDGSLAWKVTRREFDAMDRVTAVEAFATPQSDAAVAADDANNLSGASFSGSRTRAMTWYDTTSGIAIADQLQGVSSGGVRLAARTIRRAGDAYGRVTSEKECLWPDTPAPTDGLPACDDSRVLSEAVLSYDHRDNVLEKRLSARESGITSALVPMQWERAIVDVRDRRISSSSAWTATGPGLHGCSGFSEPSSASWLETRTRFDILDRAIAAFAPSPTGGWAATQTTLDGLGRRLQTVDPLGNAVDVVRDLLGRPTSRESREVSGSFDKLTVRTEFGYDALGRAVEVRLRDGVNSGLTRVMRCTLDARGLVVAEWLPEGNGSSENFRTSRVFDPLGRMVEEHRHSRPVDKTAADDPYSDGSIDTEYAFDFGGRLTRITVEPGGSSSNGDNQTTIYQYDAQGRRTLRRMHDGREERTSYDDAGRPAKTTFASDGDDCGDDGTQTRCMTLTSAYDKASRRESLSATDQRLVVQHYAGTTSQTWKYDGLGRIVESTDFNGTGSEDDAKIGVTYDGLGRVIGERFGPTMNLPVTSTFGAAGLRQTLVYPNAAGAADRTVSASWDGLGRLAALSEGSTTLLSNTYAGAGRVVRQVMGDGSSWSGIAVGSTTATRWDNAGRRTGARVMAANGDLLFDETMQFDRNDWVTSVTWGHAGGAEHQDYAYDEAGRLLGFAQGPSASGVNHDFRLDEQGNWRAHKEGAPTSVWETTSIDDANAYTQFDVTLGAALHAQTRSHDETRGFMWRQTRPNNAKREFLHDRLNRLVAVKDLDAGGAITSQVTYGYYADGRVAWRREGSGERTWMVYDGANVIREITGTSITWTHTWAGSRLVSSTDSNGRTVYLQQDRLGSVVVSTHAGAIDRRATYDAYGRPVSRVWGPTDMVVPYGYAGARVDRTTGLYNMGARWYEAESGRFIEQDPIGEAGGMNLYAYVGSSPTMWVDPSGLAPRPHHEATFGISLDGRRPTSYSERRYLGWKDADAYFDETSHRDTLALIARWEFRASAFMDNWANRQGWEGRMKTEWARVDALQAMLRANIGSDGGSGGERVGATSSSSSEGGFGGGEGLSAAATSGTGCDYDKHVPKNVAVDTSNVMQQSPAINIEGMARAAVCIAFRDWSDNPAGMQMIDAIRGFPEDDAIGSLLNFSGGGPRSRSFTIFMYNDSTPNSSDGLNRINWNPVAATDHISNEGIETPAAGLFHEFAHKFDQGAVHSRYGIDSVVSRTNMYLAWDQIPGRINYFDTSNSAFSTTGPSGTVRVLGNFEMRWPNAW